MTDGTPRAAPTDSSTLRTLSSVRSVARAFSDELLTHLPDVGDLPTQRLVDDWVEQAADTLRALSDALEERLLDPGVPAPADGRSDHDEAR